MSKISIVPPRLYRCVEYYFFNFKKLEAEMQGQIDDILHHAGYGHEQTRVSKSDISDPTSQTALKIEAQFGQELAWIALIKSVIVALAGTKYEPLIRKKYLEKQPWRKTCMELPCSDPTYFAWCSDIVTYAAMRALERGLKA